MIEEAVAKIKYESNSPALKTIGNYLTKFMDDEPNFAKKIMNEKKSMKEMMQYITSEAKKQATNNVACISAESVFGWAIHYFDEDDLKFDKNMSADVSTSNNEEIQKQPDKKAPKANKLVEGPLMNIFDFLGE